MPTVLEEPVVMPVPLTGEFDEPLYEIINDQRVELPPMSVYATWIASQLFGEMLIFSRAHEVGRPAIEMLFRLPLKESRNRRPDAAFVTYARWAKDRAMPGKDNAWDVVPDLAVEVVSPNDLAEEILQKLLEYFQAGVRLVWIVYPEQQLIYVFESPTQVRGLTRQDELDGGSVLPGFRLPLAQLFTDAAPGS